MLINALNVAVIETLCIVTHSIPFIIVKDKTLIAFVMAVIHYKIKIPNVGEK